MTRFKVIVEKHPDGFVAYPLGFKGVCVAEGDTYEQALAEVHSAIRFHLETFGKDAERFLREVARNEKRDHRPAYDRAQATLGRLAWKDSDTRDATANR